MSEPKMRMLQGSATLKKGASKEGFAAALQGLCVDSIQVHGPFDEGVVSFSYVDRCTSAWETELPRVLGKYCKDWDVIGQEEDYPPVHFTGMKEKSQHIAGVERIYFPGEEAEFVKNLPPRVKEYIREHGA